MGYKRVGILTSVTFNFRNRNYAYFDQLDEVHLPYQSIT